MTRTTPAYSLFLLFAFLLGCGEADDSPVVLLDGDSSGTVLYSFASLGEVNAFRLSYVTERAVGTTTLISGLTLQRSFFGPDTPVDARLLFLKNRLMEVHIYADHSSAVITKNFGFLKDRRLFEPYVEGNKEYWKGVDVEANKQYVGVGDSRRRREYMAIAPSAKESEELLLAMLRNGDFDVVSRKLETLHRKYQEDPSIENDVDNAFDVFNRNDPTLEAPLNEWVRKAPDAPYAYLARGIYRSRLGWATRGSEWASKTSAKDIRGMGYWLKHAKADFHQALILDESQIEAYLYLMEIDMTEGGLQSPTLFEKALEINPLSLYARWYFMTTLLPRWGGSVDEMQKVIAAAREFQDRNPRLRVLEGRIDAEAGDMLFFSKDYAAAVVMYDKALRHGNFWFYNLKKGECLLELADYKAAVVQFSTVIAEKPVYKVGYWSRAQSFKMLNKYQEALKDITRAIAIEPEDDAAIAARAHLHWYNGHYDLALADFRSALKLSPAHDKYREYIKQLGG